MNTKSILLAAGVGTLLLGSLSFAAVNAKIGKNDFSAVKTAVEANQYASLSDAAKAKITEAQFVTMVQKNTEHKAVESAITAGDYTAFKNAKIAQIPTETEFQKMVTAQKARVAAQAQIEAAVKNNDFAAFKTAVLAQKAQMDVNRPTDANETPKVPTDAQLQKHFDTLIEYYKTNGSLPDVGPGFGGKGMGGMMGGKGMGGHGPRGESKKGA